MCETLPVVSSRATVTVSLQRHHPHGARWTPRASAPCVGRLPLFSLPFSRGPSRSVYMSSSLPAGSSASSLSCVSYGDQDVFLPQHTGAHTRVHTHVRTCARAHTHAYTRTCTHSHTRAHAHTPPPAAVASAPVLPILPVSLSFCFAPGFPSPLVSLTARLDSVGMLPAPSPGIPAAGL